MVPWMGPQARSGPESLTTEDNCQAPSIHCLLQYWGELRASVWCFVCLSVCLFVFVSGSAQQSCLAPLVTSSLSHRDIQPAEGEMGQGEGYTHGFSGVVALGFNPVLKRQRRAHV